MYYYAYIDSNNICQGTYAFPTQVSLPEYIYLGTVDDPSVVGKKWNATTQQWEEVVNYYYAQLNDKDIVTSVMEFPNEVNDARYIRLTTLDESLVGKWYDRTDNTFKVVPIHILADHSSDIVNYRNEDKWLSDKIDEKADASSVYTKTEVDALLASNGGGSAGVDGVDGEDGTTVVVGTTATGDAGTNASVAGVLNEETNTLTLNFTIPKGADGTNGTNGVTFTPSVSEDGVLSWTNNGGLDNPASVNIKGADGTSADITASDVLTKIKSVDGAGSGLDADTLDGKQAAEFANASHTHYISDISGLQSTLDGKAASSHTHNISNISGLQSALDGKSNSSHTHSNYFEKTGGTISGETNFSGGLVRVGSQQTLYNSGSMITLSTNNLPTQIAGSAIYSSKAISVSSDERLKKDIAETDRDKAINFIRSLKIFEYRYKDSNEKRIGVIAQQVQNIDPEYAKYFVKVGEDGYLNVGYSELIFPLIQAVQELLTV